MSAPLHGSVEHSAQWLAAIVESSDDAIVSKTLKGIVTSWNKGAERMFGYTSKEMIGRPITTLFPPDRLDEETDFQRRIARGERVEHFDTVRIRKDGETVNVSITLSPIRSADGTIIGISKIAHDITERVRLSERERAAREEAETANRLKDHFLATLSHELRTPLNAVFGWARMLETGRLDAAMQKRAIEVIARNCRTQLDLINDLLDVSRIITGRIVLKTKTLDLGDVIDAAVDSLRPMAAEKGVGVEVKFEPNTPAVIADAERLQQVVWNLLTNAVKFTERGGFVRLHCAKVGSKIELVVSDTGLGIAPDVLPHVFERFRQGDNPTTRAYRGLGLGLAIVRHFVELHGGSVRASSEGPGKGATFTVRLPVAAVHVSERMSGEPTVLAPGVELAGRLTDLRVLVVEDDDDSRELISEVLRRAGATIFATKASAEALATLARERPHVIVSDLGLPGEDGAMLMRRVRGLADEELAAIPTLALTAYTRLSDVQGAAAAGFNAHLGKPVDPVRLVDAVAQLIPRRVHV